MIKKFLLGTMLLTLTFAVQAANTGFDNASNPAYQPDNGIGGDDGNPANNTNGWVTGDNGGSGFGAWTLSNTGSGGRFIGGTGDGNPAFGLFSPTGSNTSSATRSFTGGSLLAGQSFKLDLGATGVDTGGVVGFNLLSGATPEFTFKFTGGQTFWQLNDGGSDFNTNIPFAVNGQITFSFTYDGGNNYDVLIKEGATTYTGTGFTANNNISAIDGFKLFSNFQGNGQNIGFNDITVPEPSTWVAGGMALLSLLFLRRRRAA
jgi:hypothetical protein